MSPMGLFNGLEASSTTVAYPNLKKLIISNMKHWEEWVMETSNEDINVMPLLRDLYISNCPVLKSVPHQILSQSLRKLFIRDCPELIISWLPPLLEGLILDGDAVRIITDSETNLSRFIDLTKSYQEGRIRLLICCAMEDSQTSLFCEVIPIQKGVGVLICVYSWNKVTTWKRSMFARKLESLIGHGEEVCIFCLNSFNW
ncbi:hypothetical protein GIB67_025955 [Kingdonia uniflora]|uniref:Disease resistance protein n=1 Tax=Kingdonia uniflora TaxID=39325 RepID=A0A7J7L875_9MAGN|nr:hypothetical protein GIB67_025955 [Kingdonia uniflora]